MPLFRDGLEMFRKYSAKYNPDVIRQRFLDVRDVALARAQGGLNAVDTIRAMVRDYLDQKGVTGGLRATYMAFALELWRLTSRQGGAASEKIANGLIQKYATGFDLNPALLTDIANSIIVKVTATP
jgi:hypothetical protein